MARRKPTAFTERRFDGQRQQLEQEIGRIQDLLVTQSRGAPGPVSFNHHPTFKVNSTSAKQEMAVSSDSNNDADVVHPNQPALGISTFGICES